MLTRYQARLMAHPQPSSSIPASTRTDQNHQSFQNTKSITTTIQTGTYPILSTVANGEDQSKSYSNRDTTTRNVSSLAQTMPYPPNYDRRELIRDSFDSGLAEVGDSHLGNFSQNFSTINRNTLRENNFRANQTLTKQVSGTPQARWRESTQSGRASIIECSRLRPERGCHLTLSISVSARSRIVVPKVS